MLDSGRTIAESRAHRRTFRGLSKQRRWSPLDALYFFGYALARFLQLGVGDLHHVGHDRHQLVEERIAQAESNFAQPPPGRAGGGSSAPFAKHRRYT